MTTPYRPATIPADLALILAALAPEDAERLSDAFQFAAAAHHGQQRDEGTPFIEHPVRVASILWRELGQRDVELLIAALNHDVVEDSEHVDEELIASRFGQRIAGIVLDVTKQKAPSESKAARDRAYLDRLPDLPLESRLLKLADRIDNLRSVPLAADREKAERYLEVTRDSFVPLALATDPTATRLLQEACDEVERYLES